jgi:hypothetical protein
MIPPQFVLDIGLHYLETDICDSSVVSNPDNLRLISSSFSSPTLVSSSSQEEVSESLKAAEEGVLLRLQFFFGRGLCTASVSRLVLCLLVLVEAACGEAGDGGR